VKSKPAENYLVVLVTASSLEEARQIARVLVEKRLCACVNIIDGISSTYRWKREIQEETECLLLCKAVEGDFDSIEACVKGLHSYTVPEVIAVPLVRGSREYLNWVSEETDRGTGEES